MLPIATETTLGAVKLQKGGGLSVSSDGTLSMGMRYGMHYEGKIADYAEAQYVGQWLVLTNGVLSASAENVATLQIAPTSRGGMRFPILVDRQCVGTLAFDQGQTQGQFSLTATPLSPGSLVVVGLPDGNALEQESQAAGLVLILAC